MRKTSKDSLTPQELHKKTIAKLIALIKNSRSGRTFFKNFAEDKETLEQSDKDILLKAAIEFDSYLIAAEMLKEGANPNIAMMEESLPDGKKNKIPLLHYCCQYNDLEAVKILLDAGADPFSTDSIGLTAFNYAKSALCKMTLETAMALKTEASEDTYSDMFEYEL